MTLQDWASLLVGIFSILGSVAIGIKWLVKHYLAELKPNGGGSIKDQVNKLEKRLNDADLIRRDMDRKLDKMYDILLEYVSRK